MLGITRSFTPFIRHLGEGNLKAFSTKNKAVLSVTPRAADRLIQLMREAIEPNVGVNISVKRRGCNGLSYVMNYQHNPPGQLDEIVRFKDANLNDGVLIVDGKSLLSLIGTVVDYEESALGCEFTFKNPHQKGVCGCGESFNV